MGAAPPLAPQPLVPGPEAAGDDPLPLDVDLHGDPAHGVRHQKVWWSALVS